MQDRLISRESGVRVGAYAIVYAAEVMCQRNEGMDIPEREGSPDRVKLVCAGPEVRNGIEHGVTQRLGEKRRGS